MAEANILYDVHVTNSDPPTLDTYIYDSDIYPYSYFLAENISMDSLIINKFKSILIKKDHLHTENKFIASVYHLQINAVQETINDQSIEILDKCIISVTKLRLYYPYCVNSDKYAMLLKLLLDKLQEKITDARILEYLEKYANNILIANCISFSGIRFNLMQAPHKFASFRCVDNADEMLQMIQQYENESLDEVCKYCMSSVPKETLVRPCKCDNPVHISCFKKWYGYGKDKCEICDDPFSRINVQHMESRCGRASLVEKIFFPFDDYYPVPLMTSYDIHKVSGNDRYVYALLYLQIPRMKDLLENNDTKPRFGDDLRYFIEGCLPSNYLRSSNKKVYAEMLSLLKEHGIINE